MHRRFLALYDEPLRDDGFPSLRERLSVVNPAHTVKGMFFEDVAKALHGEWASLEPQLQAPPRGGRYLPFTSYPLHDHALLGAQAAKRMFPDAGLREGLRRLHRGNLETLARSTVGRVLTAFSNDVKAGYLRVEDGFRLSRTCGTVRVQLIEERAVEVRIEDANPFVDCAELGTLEGLGRFYGQTVRTSVELDSDCSGSFVCRWRE